MSVEITDSERLDWLDETQALCDDGGDGSEFYQEWTVRASQNYRGIREAIDAVLIQSKQQTQTAHIATNANMQTSGSIPEQ